MFSADPTGFLFDSTPVCNGFVLEYMPQAPADYVKVYLYGLCLARHPDQAETLSLPLVARQLGLEESVVTRAMQYWERCRLVLRTRDNPPEYRYLSVPQALLGRDALPQDEEYQEFAQALYALFGDKRKLHGNETQLAYEWVEELGLPKEIVLMLVKHMSVTRGMQFSFKEAQKVAAQMAQERVHTIEAAEAQFSRSEAAWKGASRVLTRMSKRRAPTLDELDLFIKWTKDWGFAPKAIEAACAETTKGDPSFGYLDGILKGLMQRSGGGAKDAKQVERQLEKEKASGALVKEMLSAFGGGDVSDGTRGVYEETRKYASHEVVLLAAGIVGKKKRKSVDEVLALVQSWHDKGLADEAAVREYLGRIQRQNAALQRLLALSGHEGAPKAADRTLYQKWQDAGFSDDLISLAAEAAKTAERPMPFMDKVLSSWKEAGIRTPEEARAEMERRRAAPADAPAASTGRKPGKVVTEQQYAQRDYTGEEYEGLTAELLEEARKYDT